MGRIARRGELRLAHAGRESRPVVVLMRSEVLDVRDLVTGAEVTTSIRNLAAEVDLDHVDAGFDQRSAINRCGLHTVARDSLTGPIGHLFDDVMRKVCWATSYAIGCSPCGRERLSSKVMR